VAAHLTEAEARALGLDVKAARVRTTRRTVKGAPYRTRCCTCDEVFDTEAAENRHVAGTTHRRYEIVLTRPV
jgi:hypothetical protein